MTADGSIPVFTLFGETAQFPDILHCERIADRAPAHGWEITAHRHAQMAQLLVIEDGAVSARLDDEEIRLTGGMAIFLPAQVVHAFRFAPETAGWVLSFPLAVLRSAGPDAAGVADALARPWHGDVDEDLGDLVALLTRTMTRTGSFRAERAVGLAHALLARLAGTIPVGDAAPADPRMARLDALVADHMGDAWQVSDYARALSVSTGHLSRLCRNAAGLGAKAYVEQAILEEAARMLAFTQLPVSEIGYRTGFSDPSYFSKRFRAARGISPTGYRALFVSREGSAPAA
ncbi:helix-turn-helix domain-containing protein [Rhodobacterales bacterium HKCCE3408]|nr:helix-turn-helix domain-containing protein [Rhodobacterales bacterium HKCCE3408]